MQSDYSGPRRGLALDVVRWSLVDVDLAAATTDSEAHEQIRLSLAAALHSEADGRPLISRVRLSGETHLHDAMSEARDVWRQGVRAIAASLADTLWIEKVVLATSPVVAEQALSGEFDALLCELAADPAVEAAVAQDLADFLGKAPVDLDQELELLADARVGQFAPTLKDAAAALRARLTRGAIS